MSSYAPVAAFAALALGTVAVFIFAHRRCRERRPGMFVWRRCREEYCDADCRCEVGRALCPRCGAGPFGVEDLYVYPVALNHLRTLTCEPCVKAGRKRWSV